MDEEVWRRIVTSGSAFEMENWLSKAEAAAPPGYLGGPDHRTSLRCGAGVTVTTGNMDVLRYFCERRGVPVKFIPPDELLIDPDACNNTPLLAALSLGHEDMALYLLSLPRGDHSPPLTLNARYARYNDYPLLTMAAELGLVREGTLGPWGRLAGTGLKESFGRLPGGA